MNNLLNLYVEKIVFIKMLQMNLNWVIEIAEPSMKNKQKYMKK